MTVWNMVSRHDGRRPGPPAALKARRDFRLAASRTRVVPSASRHWGVSVAWGLFGAELRDKRFVAPGAANRRDGRSDLATNAIAGKRRAP